jgi:HSP20 family molecular chaperone IbpA
MKPFAQERECYEFSAKMESDRSLGSLKEMEEMQDRLSRAFGFGHRANGGKEIMSVSEWAPLVDITEDDKEFLIKADLPEIKREDVKVRVDNGVLTIAWGTKIRARRQDQETTSVGTQLRPIRTQLHLAG